MPGMPPEWDDAWEIDHRFQAVQLIWPRETPDQEDPEIEQLTENDVPAMIELTGLVYPAYFRPATAKLGAYFGIKRQDRLCAMAGIRMAMEGLQEVSAVCTHPEFQGQGLAKRLVLHLVDFIQGTGDTPFLHTEADNVRARTMYEKLGFHLRAEIDVTVVGRR